MQPSISNTLHFVPLCNVVLWIFHLTHPLLSFRSSIILPSTRACGLYSSNSNGCTRSSSPARKAFSTNCIHQTDAGVIMIVAPHEVVRIEHQFPSVWRSVSIQRRSFVTEPVSCRVSGDIGGVWSRETEFAICCNVDFLTTGHCNFHGKSARWTVCKDSRIFIYNW
jgi:hypothetical protein